MTVMRWLAVIALVAVIAGIGIGAYNAGVSQGVTEAARAAQAAGETPAVVYPPYVGGPWGGYGWGGGFGFFTILFWILGFFLIVALVRAAFGWGRWGRHDYRGGPGSGWGGREERMAEYHRELHRRDDQPQASSS
jgi:hypothetical protein